MVTFLPASLRQGDGVMRDALVLDLEVKPDGGSALSLFARRRGQETRLGRYGTDQTGLASARQQASIPGRLPIVLRLPEGYGLIKELTLPAVVERDLARVIGYEMDRETPFTLDEVWWRAEIVSRDRDQHKITASLCIVPQAPLAGLIAGLARVGLNPQSLDVAVRGSAYRNVPLAGAAAAAAGRQRARTMAAAAAFLMALWAISGPFIHQSLTFAALDDQIAALKPDLDLADRLRRRGTGVGSDVISVERAKLGDVLVTLAKTTDILPDDTRLTDLTLRQRKMTLIGQTAGAAKLIGLMAADPFFKDPAFSAPVTRTEGTKTEVFTISTEARP